MHVVSNGWHTEIVVAAADLRAVADFPELADYPGAAWFVFGWGDRVYFPAREKTLGMTLSAALVPTPAVLHVAALERLPADGSEEEEALRISLSEAGIRRLATSLAATVERDGEPRAPKLAQGLVPASGFYPATGSFHLFNTCNTWTVRTLRAAGLDVSPSGVVTAGEAMDRLRVVAGVEPAASQRRAAARDASLASRRSSSM